MMNFRYTKSILVAVSVGIIGFGVVGCGGGSSAVSVAPVAENERVSLEKESTSSIATSLDGLSKTLGSVDTDSLPSGAFGVSATKFSKSVAKLTRMQPSTESDTIACSVSGTVTLTSLDASGSIAFSHCKEDDMELDGVISVSGTEEAGTITVNNFVFKTKNNYNSDTSELSIATMQLAYETGYDNEPKSINLSVSGFATTTVGGQEDRVDFRINQIKITDTTALFDGSIQTTCLGGWIVVTTPEMIRYSSEGLTAGKVIIAGNNSQITIEIAADGKATLTNADLTQTVYPNIEALMEELDTGSCTIE
jgi:hypothetical protein